MNLLIPGAKDVIESVVKVYGPFAFGIVTLLIIWFSIMSPELARKQVDFETYSALVARHQQENIQQADIVRTLKDVAVLLDKVSLRLESMNGSHAPTR